MADNDFYIANIPTVIANIKRASDDIRRRLGEAIRKEAIRLLELAKNRTPVKTGALRNSGAVSAVFISSDEISVFISFGDEIVRWAISVHERTQVRHISGRSKFLESVILEEARNSIENIAAAVRL